MSRSCNSVSHGRQFAVRSLSLLLVSLSLLASSCQATPLDDEQTTGPAVQGPALIAYFTDN